MFINMLLVLTIQEQILIVIVGALFFLSLNFLVLFCIKKVRDKKIIKKVKIEDDKIETIEALEIDLVLEQMKADLEKSEEAVIQTFEDEQEEKSIISYRELLKVNNKDENENNKTKFQTSEFISPIHGIVDNKIEYPTIPKFKNSVPKKEAEINFAINDIEETIIETPIEEQISSSENFLNYLKDFRKKLD